MPDAVPNQDYISSSNIVGFNVPLNTLQVILQTIFSQSLDWCKKPVFLTNHWADSKTNIATTK